VKRIASCLLFSFISPLFTSYIAQAEPGVVTAAHPLAVKAGIEILAKGGNAFDAAVATSLALGVVEPQSSGIGGGGFALIYVGKSKETRVLDFREVAPQRATATMYQDKAGKVVPGLSINGYLAVAVPGQAAGLAQLQRTYGVFSLRTLAEPAIRLARDGFPVSNLLHTRLMNGAERLRRDPAAAAIFLPDGKVPEVGQVLKQPDLAQTLSLWAESGGESFYRGETADKLAAAMSDHKAMVSKQDMEQYKTVWRQSLTGTYRGVPILTAPSPSGGPILLEMLNIVENYDLTVQLPQQRAHLTAQAMTRGYADRSRFNGDPAFVPVPMTALIDKAYASAQSKTIDLAKATPSNTLTPGNLLPQTIQDSFKQWEGPRKVENTSHFSVIDASGNAISLTQTINGAFGAGVVAPGTGILLNNEMDDFASAPGVPNLFGLVGSKANAIAPGKRPLSSMSPTILMRGGKPWIAIGAQGGSFITTAVFQAIINIIDFKLPLQEALNRPRIHHQWQPDILLVEEGYPVPVSGLGQYGYRAMAGKAPKSDAFGTLNAAQADFSSQTVESAVTFSGASDNRREGVSKTWLKEADLNLPIPVLK
jgi:gamma-glutamyltranspeptidase / glutathione hydrolase